MQLRQQFFGAVLYKNIDLAINYISTFNIKAYLDTVSKGSYEHAIKELRTIANTKTLPNHFEYINNHIFMDAVRRVFGYGLANAGWLDQLSEFLKGKKVVEVMAGNGILSGYLQCKGINIIPTDNNSWGLSELSHSFAFSNVCFYQYTLIENISAVDAIKKYGLTVDYILMSWPPYEDDVAYNVLQILRSVNPKAQIIYIGEYNGCCANKKFFSAIENVHDSRIKKINKYFQQFCTSFGPSSMDMIHDRVYLMK